MQTMFQADVDQTGALRAMFAARKEVFIDLLRWDLPILAGRFEIDQFDTADAEYLILMAAEDRHRASARLLQTKGPHLLDTLFPHLCRGSIPRGPAVREITRFCLDRHQRARERRVSRNLLVSGLIDHALVHGIKIYTGVATLDWFEQILGFGWECAALGEPRPSSSGWLTALQIHVEPATVDRVRVVGIYQPAPMITVASLTHEPRYDRVEVAA